MTHYLLSMSYPDQAPPPPEVLEPVMAEVGRLRDEMHSAGVWVFGGGLCPPGTAAVVKTSGDQVLVTDGPYAEAKEYLGGVTVVTAPDLDAALGWGRRLAAATGLPIEVRPFAED